MFYLGTYKRYNGKLSRDILSRDILSRDIPPLNHKGMLSSYHELRVSNFRFKIF
jgi:hypothetical protein